MHLRDVSLRQILPVTGRWYAAILRRWHAPDRWVGLVNHILRFVSLWVRRFVLSFVNGMTEYEPHQHRLWSVAPRYGLAGLSRLQVPERGTHTCVWIQRHEDRFLVFSAYPGSNRSGYINRKREGESTYIVERERCDTYTTSSF
jgi:hypothetical protein